MTYLKRHISFATFCAWLVAAVLIGDTVVHPTQTIDLSGSVTGTLGVASGGTGLTSGTSGGVPYYSSSSAMTSSGALTANAIVLGGGAGASPTVLGSLGTSTTLLHGAAAGPPTFGAAVSADLNITTTGCTNQFVTAISAGGVGTCTTPTVAGAQFANQGTTTTLLHGNASGNPSWATVNLSTDTAATALPQSKGGTGYAAGTPDSCTSTNVTSSVIQTNSTDFSGTCTLTGNGTNALGVVTLDFSQTAPNGWRCNWNAENVSGGGTWQTGVEVFGSTRSTTVVTMGWLNTTTLGVNTALTAATVYWLTYNCTMF